MQNHLENRVYAGFFVRAVAFAIDSLIATLAVATLTSPFTIAAFFGADFLNKNFIFQYSILDVLSYVGVAAYFVLITYFTHTTAGKKMMRLEVVTETGEWTFLNVLYRETIGRFLSSLLCIGYLVVLAQEKKQGFHDMLCDTVVVYKGVMPRESKPPVVPQVAVAGVSPMPHPNGAAGHLSNTTTEMNVAKPPVYPAKSAFIMPQNEPVQQEITKSFDQMNPDSSNLANMHNPDNQ